MIPFKKVNRFANRGKKSEDALAKYLKAWQERSPGREANRLVDTKAAGRIIKAAAADFEFFSVMCPAGSTFGLLEVKETEHEYRLQRDKVPQLPRLRKRASCGGMCAVLVHHSTRKTWRIAGAVWLASNGDKGSWNLETFPEFETPGQALAHAFPGVFD